MTRYTIDYEAGIAGQPLMAGTGLPAPGPSSIQQAGTIMYDATHVMHGGMAVRHAPAASNVSWAAYGNNSNLNFHSTALAVRGYFYFTNTPGFAFLSVYNTDMLAVAWLGINASGRLYIRDSVTNPLAVGTVDIVVNRWLRAELYVTAAASGATITAALYDGDATTPTDTVTSSVANTTASELVSVWVGKNNYNNNPAMYWVDSLAVDTTATGFIGPIASTVDATPFRIWNGSAYIPVVMRTWNGTSYEMVSTE